MELGVQALAPDGKGGGFGQKIAPIYGGNLVVKLLKIYRAEAAKQQNDPLGGAEVQIQPGQIGQRALTQHPAVLPPDVLEAQALCLLGGHPLHPEKGGQEKGVTRFHGYTSRRRLPQKTTQASARTSMASV